MYVVQYWSIPHEDGFFVLCCPAWAVDAGDEVLGGKNNF